MRVGKVVKLGALALSVISLSVVAAGCGGDDGGGGGGLEGESVTVLGAFGGDEEKLFNDSVKPFEDDTGVDVQYTSTNDLPTLIRSRVNGGNPPDIALFPQPGLALDLAEQGATVPLEDVIDLEALKETLIPGFLEASTLEGKIYAVPMRMAVKSLVWYPVPEFEDAGYSVPETSTELTALTDEIKGSGTPPWCIGYESGQATGWVGTDWMEEFVLRTGGPEVYDKWVSHEILFNSPEIKAAAAEYEKLALAEGQTLGGRSSITSTPFGDSPTPMFDDKPGCFLHRQGNFITGFFPDPVQADLPGNVGVFYFPALDGGYDGKPLLGGGDLASIFGDSAEREAVVATLEFMASDEFGGPWAAGGGWLSPHSTFDNSQYADEITRSIADLAAEADVFRFDASDLMPAVVGAGTFWRGMTEWTSGEKELDQVLTEIDESWPSG
jgi:alpha-glucoside transport system substrate-binding protein